MYFNSVTRIQENNNLITWNSVGRKYLSAIAENYLDNRNLHHHSSYQIVIPYSAPIVRFLVDKK